MSAAASPQTTDDAKVLARRLTTQAAPQMNFVTNFLLGGSAGCLAKTACAPLERVKIVLQTAKADTGLGMLGTGRKLMAEHGAAGLCTL